MARELDPSEVPPVGPNQGGLIPEYSENQNPRPAVNRVSEDGFFSRK